jgi:hypothetical protein
MREHFKSGGKVDSHEENINEAARSQLKTGGKMANNDDIWEAENGVRTSRGWRERMEERKTRRKGSR